MSAAEQAPPIAAYGLIGDCHGAALVSQSASIDWCCVPRFDSASCFGRLMDWRQGGFCAVRLEGGSAAGEASYVEDTLVLDTRLRGERGEVCVRDFFAMRHDNVERPRRELIRVVECTRGEAEVCVEVAPRFDYGAMRPWLRRAGPGTFSAIGGGDGLLVWSDRELVAEGDSLIARADLRQGERLRLLLRYVRAHRIDGPEGAPPQPAHVDERLEETLQWWRRWREKVRWESEEAPSVVRSTLTLKALTYAPTGAVVAAPSASLPEQLGGERNWDYRYSWVRDSALTAYALAEIGCEQEAASFRDFVVRSSAGHAEDLQIVFGVEGERRITESELDLAGYRDSRPVRVGNGAAAQLQLDALGEILNLAKRWHARGHSPDDDEWRLFCALVEGAIARWREPDRGIWEWRGEARHFVHSKAACWTAVECGLRLAEECMRDAPVERWRAAREEIRVAIESRGYDRSRGVFVQSFGEQQLDAALLQLPVLGFVEFADERMERTADAVREELEDHGFLRRYRGEDGLAGEEGAFLPCSFWLAECYARQGRVSEAREVFERAISAASPLGLFAEQVDPASGALLGNYPQTLTHLSHLAAAAALAECEQGAARSSRAAV
jgi:GH15 family glucan-1,4-alpha-glucosidase